MAKKIRRMRTFARTASKSMEKNVVQNAIKLMKNPFLVIPEFDDPQSEKYFKKIAKKIAKVEKYKDDQKKLEKLSKKRDISGAVAGTLLIAHAKKAPYLAVAKLPSGEVTYAKRGRADKEHLIAVQHFDDPVLRLLGIKDLVLKKDLHVYSWDKGYISTGKKADPPDDFIDFIIKKTDLNKKNGIVGCKHINPENVKNKSFTGDNYLRIYWKSADTIFSLCEKCAQSSKKNTFFQISKYILHSEIANDFVIETVLKEIKGEKSVETIPTKYLDEYTSGKINDIQLIDKNVKHKVETIKTSGEKNFILDNVSYGDNIKSFIEALKPDKYEKEGLEIILEKVNEPVVLDKDATPNTVLRKFWDQFGLEVLEKIIQKKDMAKKLFSLNDPPSEILELACNYREQQEILSRLPSYDSLPPLAKYADNVARTFKTAGKKKAINAIEDRPDDTKFKSLAYAFLLAFEKSQDKKWKYSKVEIEYGEFLKQYAEKLLHSDPDNYHKNLQELLVASGSSEKI